MNEQVRPSSQSPSGSPGETVEALRQALEQRTAERDLARQELHRRLLESTDIPNTGGHALIARLSSVVAELQRVAEELEQRNTALAEANWNLERRVEERTAALRSALETRREDENRFRAVADNLPQLVWTSKPEGHWTYSNQRWKTYTGKSEAETLDMGWLDAVHPDDRERTMQAWHEASVSGKPLLVEHRLLQADGTPRWFETQAVPSPSGSGIPWVGSCSDIHARKLAQFAMEDTQAALERELALRQQELDDTESRFLAYFDISTEALFTALALPDGSFMLDQINAPCERMTGLSTGGFGSRRLADLLPEAADAFEANFRQTLEHGVPHSFDVTTTLPVGQRSLRVVLVPTRPRPDGDGTASSGEAGSGSAGSGSAGNGAAAPGAVRDWTAPRALLGSVRDLSNV